MQFVILKPLAKQEYDVAWVEFNTSAGNYVILPGHAPLILSLTAEKEVLYCLKSGKVESFMLHHGGIVEIQPDLIHLIIAE